MQLNNVQDQSPTERSKRAEQLIESTQRDQGVPV